MATPQISCAPACIAETFAEGTTAANIVKRNRSRFRFVSMHLDPESVFLQVLDPAVWPAGVVRDHAGYMVRIQTGATQAGDLVLATVAGELCLLDSTAGAYYAANTHELVIGEVDVIGYVSEEILHRRTVS